MLIPSTVPRELNQRIITEMNNPEWRSLFQESLEQIENFEHMLNFRQYIDMVQLATVDEIRSGKVYIASPYQTYPEQPVYTPETYILHLKNILRLMEQYENYYFVPYDDRSWENYNLIVNSDGMALLVRTSAPPQILEMKRPELVIACYEHLLRKAEKIGYDGAYKQKIYRRILKLIKELQSDEIL